MCKCDQGKVILDEIEFLVRKIIHKVFCLKVHGL